MDLVVDNPWSFDWAVPYDDEAHDRDLFFNAITGSTTASNAQLEPENLSNDAYGQDHPIDAFSLQETEPEIPAYEGVIDPETGLELEVVFPETSSIATAASSIQCNTNYSDNPQSYDYSSSNPDHQLPNAAWHNNPYPNYQSSSLLPNVPYQSSSAFYTTCLPRPSNSWKLFKFQVSDERTSPKRSQPRWPPPPSGIFDDSAVLLHHPYDNQNSADKPDHYGSTDLSVFSEPSNAGSSGLSFSPMLLHGVNLADRSDGVMVGHDSSRYPLSFNPSTSSPSSTPHMLVNCPPITRHRPTHQPRVTCEVCGSLFSSKVSLHRHKMSACINSERLICPLENCSITMSNRIDSLRRHFQMEHQEHHTWFNEVYLVARSKELREKRKLRRDARAASGHSPSGSRSTSTSSSTMSAAMTPPQADSRSQTLGLGVDVAWTAVPASSNPMTLSLDGASYQFSGGPVRTRVDEWQTGYPPNRFHPY